MNNPKKITQRDQAVNILKDKVRHQAMKTKSVNLSGSNSVYTAHSKPRQNESSKIISQVQGKLSGPELWFSKVIHIPVIETSSDVLGNTVARPSSLVLGGLIGLISSVVLLIVCNYYGYEYNYLLSLGGFVVGYLLGFVGDLIRITVRKK